MKGRRAMKKVLTAILVLSMILSFSIIGFADEAAETMHPDEECDVVVIGGGGSGIAAACTAFDEGLDVIIVEKMPMLGGNTNLATTQMWAAGSRMQQEAGQTETAEDFYNFIMSGKGAGLGLEPNATMFMCENSGAAVDWLLDNGVEFGRVFNIYSHGPADGGAPGPVIMTGLRNALDTRGIDYRLNTKATEILMNEEGAACGIKVESPEGNYTINAKCVVIAAGGFANNNEMVTQYDPRWPGLGCNSSPSQTGDGIIMGEAVGAKLGDMENITINPTVLYRDEGLYSLTALRTNGAILVNNSGKRFWNEESAYTPQAEALLQQDKQEAFMIFDQTMLDTVGLIAQYAERDFFAKADTVEDLADQLGIDPAGLAETVETYKGFVEAGEDAEFGRKFMTVGFDNPPYYGVKVFPSVQTTSGGIVINFKAEVISTNDTIIPGLFACGAVTCDGTRAVSPLTKTFVYGRAAGASAVAYVKGE